MQLSSAVAAALDTLDGMIDAALCDLQIPLPPKIDPSVTMMTVEEKPDITYRCLSAVRQSWHVVLHCCQDMFVEWHLCSVCLQQKQATLLETISLCSLVWTTLRKAGRTCDCPLVLL
jgi:hypothetical protein